MDFIVDEKNVRLMGRTLSIDGIRYIDYSGSGIEFEFTGKKAEVVLWTDKDNWLDEWERFCGWVAVFVNGILTKRIPVKETEASYVLFESDVEQTVTVQLIKISEALFAKIGIKKLILDGTPKPTKPKTRKIEFIGDSITCGYGIEGKQDVDLFSTATENPWKAYAMQTARNLGADCNLVCWSGIGIISNWVPPEIDEPQDSFLMPNLYQYTDLGLSQAMKLPEHEKWDFNKFVPDIIVVNLGTNDSSYTRGIEERVNLFGKKYFEFLTYIRKNNPDANILCTLGVMGQELCPEVEKQVELFAKTNGDTKIHFLSFDVQLEEDGIGIDYHPNETTNNKMAKRLTERIAQIMEWNVVDN